MKLAASVQSGVLIALVAGMSVVCPEVTGGRPLWAVDGEPERATAAFYVTVPLPLSSSDELSVRRIIEGHLAALNPADGRPIAVLEFRTREGTQGEGTDVAQAFSLARYLTSEKLSGVRTVAYLPGSVRGHGVLAVLACEELVMAPDAEMGEAGMDDKTVDQTVRRLYADMAEKRRTVPPAVVAGMLSRDQAVFRVQTVDGVRYTLQEELDRLQKEGQVTAVETIVRPGELGRFTGREMRLKFGFASHLVSDRAELAGVLNLPPQALEEDPSRGKGWKALHVEINGPIHSKAIVWIERSLQDRLKSGAFNFVGVTIDSSGGAPVDSLRLAHFLASLPRSAVRTVAFVPRQARGDAFLIAFACDHLVVAEDAILGGPGNATINERQLVELSEAVKTLAREKEKRWSLPVALLDPNQKIYRYARGQSGETSVFSEAELTELENAEAYKQGAEIPVASGLTGKLADELRISRFQAESFDEFTRLYHLEGSIESIKPNWAHVLIEHLASPRLAGTLLFIAFFAFFVELSTPGVGVAGFVSGLCLMLFFWANFLHGTAGWLEILLFAAGAACLLLEIFVLPGVGIFGIGGVLMMVISIVLASQTFVIPRNPYQLSRLPVSILMVIAAGSGAIASIAMMRRFLPNTPVLNRMMLSPPDEIELEDLQRREALVDYDDLLGQIGVTTTELIPGGKARFGDRFVDVLTDGELIERGQPVRVVQVRGSEVLVARK